MRAVYVLHECQRKKYRETRLLSICRNGGNKERARVRQMLCHSQNSLVRSSGKYAEVIEHLIDDVGEPKIARRVIALFCNVVGNLKDNEILFNTRQSGMQCERRIMYIEVSQYAKCLTTFP